MSFIAQITADISNFDKNIKKATDITNSSVSKMQAQFAEQTKEPEQVQKPVDVVSEPVTQSTEKENVSTTSEIKSVDAEAIVSNFDTDLGAVVGLSSVIDPEEENS